MMKTKQGINWTNRPDTTTHEKKFRVLFHHLQLFLLSPPKGMRERKKCENRRAEAANWEILWLSASDTFNVTCDVN